MWEYFLFVKKLYFCGNISYLWKNYIFLGIFLICEKFNFLWEYSCDIINKWLPFTTRGVLPWFLGHHWCAESAESLFINWQNFPALNWMHKSATWECLNTCFHASKFQIQLVPTYILNSNSQNLTNTKILKSWGVLSVAL